MRPAAHPQAAQEGLSPHLTEVPQPHGPVPPDTRVVVRQSVAALSAGYAAAGAAEARLDPAGVAEDGFASAVPPQVATEPAQHTAGWGFRDTAFTLHADRTISLSGDRYPLAGQRLPYAVPWVEKVLGVALAHDDVRPRARAGRTPSRADCSAFLASLSRTLEASQVSVDPDVRRRHAHGHTQKEIFALNFGEGLPLPDAVVYPSSHAEVEAVVAKAIAHDVVLVPYGGGTSVTEALMRPHDEARPVISLDTSRLDRLVWVDPVNKMAAIEAGAKGRHIAAALAPYGLTIGHEPDSVEFSTLGGWIATHASGMKKNRYGNIEDIVLDMTVVTADGTVRRPWAHPRESTGIDVRRLMYGSEGRLGVITQAVVRLFDLPEAQSYASVLFEDFDRGIAFMQSLGQGEVWPASARLVDNLQFQFGMALRTKKEGLAALPSQLAKLWVTGVRGMDPEKMVACTLVLEGTKARVARDRQAVLALAKRFGGLAGGSEHGRRGYQLTFGIAYIRDFLMKHWIMAESFETSVAWSGVALLIERVKRRMMREHHARGLPGRPVVLARVTQIYGTGACVYFYMALYLKGVARPDEVFADMEEAARDEILQAGGSLSHHHGVGKLRQKWLPKVMSAPTLAWSDKTKAALDPKNVFGCGNQQHHLA